MTNSTFYEHFNLKKRTFKVDGYLTPFPATQIHKFIDLLNCFRYTLYMAMGVNMSILLFWCYISLTVSIY